jgi:P-type Ca2+ transporter type 2C
MKPILERPNGNERRLIEICGTTPDEGLKSLSTTEQGLNKSQVESLQEEFGPNEISRGKRISFLSGILRRFANPLVVLLLVICVVSLSMGDLRSTIVVG